MRQIEHNGQNVPLWATEITQLQIAKSLEKLVGNQAMLKKLNDQMDKLNKRNKQSDDDLEDHQKEQTAFQKTQQGILKGIKDNTKHGGVGVAILGNLRKDFKIVSTAALGLVGSFITGSALIVRSSINMGDNLTRLMQTGVGLDGVSGSTIQTIASLNRLGMTTEQVVSLLDAQSGVVQALSKEGFVKINQQFADLTNQGAQFGLTMQEATELLGEDLKIRERLGILGQIDSTQQAQRSQELYEQQLQATRLLGRSIEDIRGASRKTLEENASAALRLQQLSSNLGADAASEFITGFQKLAGNLAGQGIDQSLIDLLGNEMLDAVPFMSQQGQELHRTLSVLQNQTGEDITGLVREFNELTHAGDISGALEAGENLEEAFARSASAMDAEGFANLQMQLQHLGSAGQQLALSLGQQRRAAERLANMSEDEAKLERQLIKNTQLLNNSLATIRGSFSGLFSEFSANLMAEPLSQFAKALNENVDILDENGQVIGQSSSIMQTFRDMVGRVTVSFTERLSALTGGKGLEGLAKLMQNRINPMIDRMGDSMVNFVGKIIDWAESGGIERAVDGIITTFQAVSTVASALSKAFGWVLRFIAPETTTGEGDDAETTRNISWGRIIGLIAGAMLAKAVVVTAIAAIAAKVAKMVSGGLSAAGGVAGKVLGGSKSPATVAPGTGKDAITGGAGQSILGISKAFAAAGKMAPAILKGAGAISAAIVMVGGAVALAAIALGKTMPILAEGIKSFTDIDAATMVKAGAGLAAFAAGMAVAGTLAKLIALGGAAISAAITVVGVAVSAVAVLASKTLPAFIDAFKRFEELDGNKLVNTAKGIGAIGLAMAAFGAGQAVQGIGGLISGLTGFFGGDNTDAMFKKLEDFQKYNFDAARIENNANAVVAYSRAMAAFGAGSAVGGIGSVVAAVADGIVGLFGGGRDQLPWDRMKAFGEANIDADGVKANAEAVTAFAQAMQALGSGGDGIGAASRVVGAASRMISNWFAESQDVPWQKMKDFGTDKGIKPDGVKANAEAVTAFAQAMQALGGGNLGDASAIDRVKGMFSKEIEIPWDAIKGFAKPQKIELADLDKNAKLITSYASAMEVVKASIGATTQGVFAGAFSKPIEAPWEDITEFAKTPEGIGEDTATSIETNAVIVSAYATAMEAVSQALEKGTQHKNASKNLVPIEAPWDHIRQFAVQTGIVTSTLIANTNIVKAYSDVLTAINELPSSLVATVPIVLIPWDQIKQAVTDHGIDLATIESNKEKITAFSELLKVITESLATSISAQGLTEFTDNLDQVRLSIHRIRELGEDTSDLSAFASIQENINSINVRDESITQLDKLTQVLDKLSASIGGFNGIDTSGLKDALGMVKAEQPEPPSPATAGSLLDRYDIPERRENMQGTSDANTNTNLTEMLARIAENSNKTNRLLTTLNDSIRSI